MKTHTHSNGNGVKVQNNPPTTPRQKKPGGATGKGFQPGKSGNPGGRPKGVAEFGRFLREWLNETDPAKKANGKTRLMGMVENLATNDPKVILAYAYGKPLETKRLIDDRGEEKGGPDEFSMATDQQLQDVVSSHGVRLVFDNVKTIKSN